MKIAILTQYFPPEMGAPQARLSELALHLQRQGHEFTIITAMPNYPTGRIFPEYRRGLVERFFRREEWNGLHIVRTAIFPSKSANPIVRLASYMSFVVSSLLLATWFVGRQDLLIVESPPLFLSLSGVPMAWWLRARLVLMVSDIWPDIGVRMGCLRGARQIRLLEALERWAYRHSACVALTNPGAVDQIRGRFPDLTCAIISNGVDTKSFRPDRRSEDIRAEFGVKPGQFAAAYCGLHGLAQGLEVVVDAASRLRDHPNIRFVMVGDGPTKQDLMARAQTAGLTNIAFYPHQPKARMPTILASMDVSLIPLAASLPVTMPSKLYEALAAGVPAIVTAGCEAEQLVRQYDVGRTAEAGNADQVAAAILELAQNAKRHAEIARNALALSRRFDRNVIAERTERILSAVAAGTPVPQVDW
ncbi:MAG: glycosyltransferase family 4 protein [Phycisphaerae bacterium]|jgi:glycosyltransferase involved in cell wall biosynthesis